MLVDCLIIFRRLSNASNGQTCKFAPLEFARVKSAFIKTATYKLQLLNIALRKFAF